MFSLFLTSCFGTKELKEDYDIGNFPKLTGDYLGQDKPDSTAIKFAPHIISRDDSLEGKIVFSPDGNSIYYQVYREDYTSAIYVSNNVDNKWTEPKEVSFSVGENILLSGISSNGTTLYLSTNVRGKTNLMSIEILQNGFGEPQTFESPINSSVSDTGLHVLADNSAYFSSSRDGAAGKDIYYIKDITDQNPTVENIGSIINSDDWDFSPCVSSDGSYMIFGSDRLGRKGLAHLYISFYDEQTGWQNPINLNDSGAVINDDENNQSNPSLSPDGKYLFFMRHLDDTVMDLYWVSTDFIEELK